MSIQTYARIVGVLFLLTMICGGFGEAYVPSRILASGDATRTAHNLQASEALFRLGFAAYLVEALCDVALSLMLYVLLRPVRNDLALLAAFFGIVSTTLFAAAELFYFAAPVVLRNAPYLQAFSVDQRNALAMMSLKLYGLGSGVFMVFYGVASMLRGYLIFRSEYLPKFLGVLLAVAGLGFVIRNFALVLAPPYASDILLLPMFLAALSMTVWFLAKGVDVAKWEKAIGA